MYLSGEFLQPQKLGVAATAALAVMAVNGCGEYTPPAVEAAVSADTVVRTAGDRQALIEIGTAVTALCSVIARGEGFTLHVKVNEGPQEGEEVNIPRRNLDATSDPYKAGDETPKQDPFGPLRRCDELD